MLQQDVYCIVLMITGGSVCVLGGGGGGGVEGLDLLIVSK